MNQLINTALTALEEATHAALDAGALHAMTPCAEWTVAQVLQHAAIDQQIWAATITDSDPPAAADPFHPQGLTGNATRELVTAATEHARRSWSAIDEDTTEVATPLPQGRMPASTAAALAALDAAVHAWDVTAALGQTVTITGAPEMLTAARTVVEPLRTYGVYADALTPAPSDGPQGLLLRLLGRDPAWTR